MSKKIWWIIVIVAIVALGMWYWTSNQVIAPVDNQTAMVIGGRGHKGGTFGYDKVKYWSRNCPDTSCEEAFHDDCYAEAFEQHNTCISDGTAKCEKERKRDLRGSRGWAMGPFGRGPRGPVTQQQADRTYKSCITTVNITCDNNRRADEQNCETMYDNCMARGCDSSSR